MRAREVRIYFKARRLRWLSFCNAAASGSPIPASPAASSSVASGSKRSWRAWKTPKCSGDIPHTGPGERRAARFGPWNDEPAVPRPNRDS